MRFMSASLVALSLALFSAEGRACAAGRGTVGAHATPQEVDQAALARRVAELEERMQKIEGKKAYASLFESSNRDILWLQTHFFGAKKAAHDAVQSLKGCESVETSEVDSFHLHLREYLINLEEMPPNHAFGETKTPDKAALKKLIAEIKSLVDYANKTPGFQDVFQRDLRSDSGALESVEYAKRCLNEIYGLVDNRTLTFVSSQAISNARDLRLALDEVWYALERLVDADGNRLTQLGDDGRPLPDQLLPFKDAMQEAVVQAEFFKNRYQPYLWRDAQRRRVDLIIDKLSKDGFYKRLVAVKALKLIPTN